MRRVNFCFGALLFCGCALVGPNYAPPVTPTADALPAFPSAPSADATITNAAPAAQWWKALGDPVLDSLVEQALTANYDLQVAVANVAAARAQLTQFTTRQRPSADLNGVLRERREASAAQRNADPEDANPTTALGTLGVDLSWEIDLFGRIRRSIEAATADLGSLEAVRNNVQVAVLATVANAYIELRGAQARLEVATRNVSVQQQTLELVDLLNKEGAATAFDVARARTQLLSSQATIPPLRSAITSATNQLTTLTAQPLGSLNDRLGVGDIPKLPELITIGAPADLLRRRPDIQAAERALAASTARIGVATADLFPTVTLLGNVGVSASPLGGLADAGAPFFSLGPSIQWDLFDRSAIYARIAQADAAAAGNLARYQATVTSALQEVDSALSDYRNERERRHQLDDAHASSIEASKLARLRYQEGVEDFLTVLDAERSLLQVEDQLAVSRINVAQRLVDIHRALGGGWETPR